MSDQTVLLNLGVVCLLLAFWLSSQRRGDKSKAEDDWHDNRPKR